MRGRDEGEFVGGMGEKMTWVVEVVSSALSGNMELRKRLLGTLLDGSLPGEQIP